jgi:hypothetical protein
MQHAPSSLESPTLPLPPPHERNPENALRTARRIKEAGMSDDGSRPIAKGARTEPAPHHLANLTPDLIRNNDLSLVGPSLGRFGIDKFLPELNRQKPDAVLRRLAERYRENPNVNNSLLLQHAVNSLSSAGWASAHLRQEIDRAVSVLHKKASTNDKTSDDIFSWLYVDANFGGASVFADLPQGWIYWRQPYVGDAMNDKISSLSLACTGEEVGGNIALFENAGFVGRYQNYGVTLPAGANLVEEDVSYVGDDFNDITSSFLIVRRFANETSPVSLKALIPPDKITAIVNQQSGISSNGDPTITWDMWPTGPTSSSDWHPNDPGKRFIYVLIPIKVHTPWPFPDADAQVRYWIYLYVDDQGQLQGYTAYWGYWVGSCCFLTQCITGDVANGLAEAIPGTLGQVDALVSDAIGFANLGGPYRFSYFLPGDGGFTGSTWDNVTVVAVKQ